MKTYRVDVICRNGQKYSIPASSSSEVEHIVQALGNGYECRAFEIKETEIRFYSFD